MEKDRWNIQITCSYERDSKTHMEYVPKHVVQHKVLQHTEILKPIKHCMDFQDLCLL